MPLVNFFISTRPLDFDDHKSPITAGLCATRIAWDQFVRTRRDSFKKNHSPGSREECRAPCRGRRLGPCKQTPWGKCPPARGAPCRRRSDRPRAARTCCRPPWGELIMQIHRAARRRRCHDDAMQFHRKAAPFRAKEFLLRGCLELFAPNPYLRFGAPPFFACASQSLLGTSPVAQAADEHGPKKNNRHHVSRRPNMRLALYANC